MRTWLIAVAMAALVGACGSGTSEPAPAPATAEAAEEAGRSNDGPRTAQPELPPHQVFDTAADALRSVLASKPRAIGFGEYHQTVGNEHIPSALRRFITDLLEPLGAHATDLVVETWAEYGNCGEAEKKVSKNVKKETERPAQTESEVVTLLRLAKERGMAPHYLPFDCDDYRALLGEDGQVDYEKLLLLITQRLQASAIDLLAEGKTVALYGGSTHNDLYPDPAVEDLSYATAVRERSEGSYVEVDLYVPEFVAGDALLSKEPWYPLLDRAAPDKVVLVERGPGSYILLMRRSAPEKP